MAIQKRLGGGPERKMVDCGDMKPVRQVSASLTKRSPASIDIPSTREGGAMHFRVLEDPYSQNLNADGLDRTNIIMDYGVPAKPNGQAYPVYAEGSQIRIGQIYQIPSYIRTINITKNNLTR